MANSNKEIKKDLINVYNRLSKLNKETWEKESDEIKKEIEKIIVQINELEKTALSDLTEEKNKKVLKNAMIKGEVESEFNFTKPKRKTVYSYHPILRFFVSPLFIVFLLATIIVLLITLLVL